MSVADGTILRIVAQMLWTDGNIVQNVFNAVVSGAGAPWDDTDILDDAEAWLDDMYLNMTNLVSDELDGNTVTVYKYDAIGDDWDEVGSQAWTWNPTNANEQLPRGVAGLLNLGTTDPDVQGKKYVAGITEASLEDGLYDATLLIGLLALGADWLTAFVGGASGGTWTPGVWSVVGTVFKAAVANIVASAIPSYQRRRKRNVGI